LTEPNAVGQPAPEEPRRARSRRFLRFFLGRIGLGVVTIFLVSVIVFGATQLLPGDAARAILGRDVTPQRLAEVRQQLHLDRPVVNQYWSWLSGVVTGDLGTSIAAQQPVSRLVRDRIVNSGVLVGLAALIAFPLSILIGALAAYRRDTLVDHVNSVVSVVLAALPDFVIAITLVLLLSTTVFHVLPAVSIIESGTPIWRQLRQLILPVFALVLYEAPYVSRIMRASMIEVLESDYVEMARLKGVPEWKVVARHALPNAIVPTIQVIAVQLAVLIGGIVAIEYVFAFPGIGQELVTAVSNRDVPVVQAIALLVAGGYVAVNLVADVATILISPRLRTSLV
jgi:peptide/nickel transport system permease protein